jgi:transposase
MIRIAVCDDENVIVNQIEHIISEVCKRESIPVNIDVFYSGRELKRQVTSGTKYDIIFLDIQMKGGDGITAAENIRKVDDNVLLIYVSGYDKYMMELFRLDVFGFIKKPIDEDFKRTLVELYHNGKTQASLIKEYGVSQTALSRWVKQYSTVETDDGEVLTAKQVKELQKRMAQLEEENQILKKAIAIFTPHSSND